MKSTKSKVATVTLTAVDELPDVPARVGPAKPAEHWQSVADAVKAAPGQWHAVKIGGFGVATHRSAVGRIKNATKTKLPSSQRLMSFNEPGYDAAWRDGHLYVHYDAPAAKGRRNIRVAS